MRIRDWSSDVCSSDLVYSVYVLTLTCPGLRAKLRHTFITSPTITSDNREQHPWPSFSSVDLYSTALPNRFPVRAFWSRRAASPPWRRLPNLPVDRKSTRLNSTH